MPKTERPTSVSLDQISRSIVLCGSANSHSNRPKSVMSGNGHLFSAVCGKLTESPAYS